MGQIVPVGLTEVLPGDTIQQATSALIRVSPLVAPVMHPVQIRIHHWFVPNRLVWQEWEDFITGGPDGLNAAVPPYLTEAGGSVEGSIYDYYGVPPGTPFSVNDPISALPFRGYNLIFNEWYRDQDLVAERAVPLTSGADATNYNVLNAAWEKDYFTTARPWVTKGGGVTLPIGISAPVISTGDGQPIFNYGSGGALTGGLQVENGTPAVSLDGGDSTVDAPATWNATKLVADLQQASAVGINELREAFALQRYQEARARYGSRYTEYLAYLGIRAADARLQRPEYLGGGKQSIQFSEVLQTGPNDPESGNTIGGLAGHGIGALRSNRYRRFFSEHGYIHSFMIVLPKTMYAQALPRTFSRRTKEDYWQKELQFIGQQEVYNREVYSTHTTPGGIFGYQDRYDEYRRTESAIAGQFRSTLDYWHMARIYAADPVLNGSFVESHPTKRIFADQTEGSNALWCMVNHSIQARRMVAKQGTSFIS